jgi:single-strand DNA-binding protein
MSEQISVTGLIATTPRHLVTQEGLPITSFRLASAQRRFDKNQNKWIDADTNWFTVSVFRQLAINAAQSLSKGDRVVLHGRLRVRDWDNGERSGTTVEIEADSLGQDLNWGVSQFTRTLMTLDLPGDLESPADSATPSEAESEEPKAKSAKTGRIS